MSRRQDRSSSRRYGTALRIAGGRRGRARLPRGLAAPRQVDELRSALVKAEMLNVGDAVETAVELPGIPRGSTGKVREVEPLFVAVEFDDGRIGYYSPRQLHRVTPPPASQPPPPHS